MDAASTAESGKEESSGVSDFPDFAEIYLFLENFGSYINLPRINLRELENFFINEPNWEEDQVVHIQWCLLRNAGKHGGKDDWQRMAVKFARKSGLISSIIPYQDVSLQVRMKIFRLSCEEQFDCNMKLLNNLKQNSSGIHSQPLGVDRKGLRYWLLQDSMFDVRLYGEGCYDEVPPITATWVQLARSLDDLAIHISIMESKSPGSKKHADSAGLVVSKKLADSAGLTDSGSLFKKPADLIGVTANDRNSHTDFADISSPDAEGSISNVSPSPSSKPSLLTQSDLAPPPPSPPPPHNTNIQSDESKNNDGSVVPLAKSSQSQRRTSKRSKNPKKGWSKKKAMPLPSDPDGDDVSGDGVGCLKCRKDVNYDQMLLCDVCDRECHTYCQYPVLWGVPKGKWVCPICKEEELIKLLKETYMKISLAKAQYERQQERKQRSVARLQKSGLLLQNIILEEGEENQRRSRRNRKEINYAELNDVYLPPLGPRDVVGRESLGLRELSSTRTRRNNDWYVQEDYLAPRIRNCTTRRRRYESPGLDPVKEKDEEVELLNKEEMLGQQDNQDQQENHYDEVMYGGSDLSTASSISADGEGVCEGAVLSGISVNSDDKLHFRQLYPEDINMEEESNKGKNCSYSHVSEHSSEGRDEEEEDIMVDIEEPPQSSSNRYNLDNRMLESFKIQITPIATSHSNPCLIGTKSLSSQDFQEPCKSCATLPPRIQNLQGACESYEAALSGKNLSSSENHEAALPSDSVTENH